MRMQNWRRQAHGWNGFWKSRCCGTMGAAAVGLLITVLCVFGFSALITNIDAPEGLVSSMSCVALCAGSFTSGYVGAKRRRRHGILTGLLCGVVMYCIVFVFGLVMMSSFSCAGLFLKLFLILLCGAIGGVCGVNACMRRPPR